MFAPKTQNKNQSPNPNSGLGSNFIQPKMEVVKSDEKKEDKGVSKEQPKKEADKTTFFAPQKVTAKKEEDKKENGTKEEGKETPNSLGEKQTASTSQILTTITETNAKQEVKPDKQPTVKAKKGEASKEQTGKKEKEGKEKKEEVGKEEQSIPKAPTRPEDDPAFQQQIKQTEQTRDEKSQHPQAETKVAEQKEAGHASAEAQSRKNDQQAHSEAMNATSEAEKKREPFTPESFKKMLEKNLNDLEKELPKNSDEAKEFREEKPINKIKNNISSQVTAESNKLAGPMKNEADKPAPASGQPTQEAKQLPAAAPGATPKPLNAKSAVPKPKTSQEISMEKESQSLDDYMAENKVTDEQLAKSNEPKFTGALEEKNNAQTEATLAPVKYRKKEQEQLAVAKKVADGTGKAGMEQMQAAKVLSENTVLTNQTTNKTNDKTEQEKIYAEFEKIYESTKKTVTDSLEQLSENVDKKFSQEAETAQKTFEKNVEDGLGEIYGWTVVDDWIFGEDTEAIDKLFRKEKSKFITTMNKVLDDISVIIANGLNGALDAIAEGKKKSKEKFDSLDASQKKLAEDAFNDFNGQYTDLEDTVYEKQEELAADLARSYKENVDSLQGKFDEIKEKVSAGWIGAAFNALAGVIKTILKIKDMLLNLLSAAVSAIGAIISDPIGFLSNLIQGVKQGFVDFGTNIKQHIIKGLIEWLTGSLGNVGITMPDNLFSLSGIFSLVTQMLGLTWDYFRGKAVKHLGEPMVGAMEKGVEIFQIVRKDGVKGLWEYIKEQFTNLKEMVMDAIRDMIITKVIEAGIKWIMGLLSPAGAFVKAAMMIIDIVKFFVERAAQIFELVNAFINSIKALAAGNVKAVAKAIETALAKAIPVLISFLAALVGVTGLTGKIQKIIKKVRKKIDKAIDKIIFKAKKTFKNLVKKGKAKVKGAVKKLISWWKYKKKFKDKNNEEHTLFFEGKGNASELMKRSVKKKVREHIQAHLKDSDPAVRTKAEAARVAYEAFVTARTLAIKGGKTPDEDERLAEALQTAVNNVSEKLREMPGDFTPADYPTLADMQFHSDGNKPTKVKKDYITDDVQYGSGPRTEDVTGWDVIKNRLGLTGTGNDDPWIRFHLINDNLGGHGDANNLVPTPNNTNKAYQKFEDKTHKLVFNTSSRGQNANAPNQKNVVWLETKVKYFSGDLSAFAKRIDAEAGIYHYRPKEGRANLSQKWIKDTKAVFATSLEVPDPHIMAKGVSLGKSGKQHISNFLTSKGIGHTSGLLEAMVNNRPYSGKGDFIEKVTQEMLNRKIDDSIRRASADQIRIKLQKILRFFTNELDVKPRYRV